MKNPLLVFPSHGSRSHGGDSIAEIVDLYRCYLWRNGFKAHYDRFLQRLASDPKAAEAEAVVFSLLRAENVDPRVFEDASTGGPDFQCHPPANESFLVEVTSLDSTALANKSKLPLMMSGGNGAQSFLLITDKLKGTAKRKAPQLGRYSLPGVLAITSDYDYATLLLGKGNAEYLMTSAPQINVPIDGRPDYITTDLQDAVFCRLSRVLNSAGVPSIDPCRQSISAILLITIYPHEASVVGLLHPEATHPFDPNWFPKVPYLRFKNWPLVVGNQASTEWILGDEEHREAAFPHRRIR
jgi:hypothetical protein